MQKKHEDKMVFIDLLITEIAELLSWLKVLSIYKQHYSSLAIISSTSGRNVVCYSSYSLC